MPYDREKEAKSSSLEGLMDTMDEEEAKQIPAVTLKLSVEDGKINIENLSETSESDEMEVEEAEKEAEVPEMDIESSEETPEMASEDPFEALVASKKKKKGEEDEDEEVEG